MHDLRYAIRALRRAPGFTLVAVTALALGIAANTAIFSVVNAILLKPLPYRDPSRLAIVWEHNLPTDRKNNVVSPGNYLHWRDMNRVFEEMAAVGTFRTTLSGRGDPEELSVQYTTSELFPLLGVPAQRGRWFTHQDEAPDVNVAILSDRLWRGRFNADPNVLNTPITLDGVAHTVVGRHRRVAAHAAHAEAALRGHRVGPRDVPRGLGPSGPRRGRRGGGPGLRATRVDPVIALRSE